MSQAGSGEPNRFGRRRAVIISDSQYFIRQIPCTPNRFRTTMTATTPQLADTDRMMQMITGYWITQIVHAAATYSLADHVADAPATAAEIAAAEGTDPSATFRFLRTCASLGLLTYDGESRFAGTSLLDTLRMTLSRFHVQQVMRRSIRPRSRQGSGSRLRCAGVADCNSLRSSRRCPSEPGHVFRSEADRFFRLSAS